MFLSAKPLIFGAVALVCTGLGGCETMPNSQRASQFEANMRQRFIGKSADEVVIAFGPPERKYQLSDGREVIQFEKAKPRNTQSGFGSVIIGTSFGGYSRHSNYGGLSFGIPIYGANTYGQNSPDICIQRFIIDKDKIVREFAWEGRSCF